MPRKPNPSARTNAQHQAAYRARNGARSISLHADAAAALARVQARDGDASLVAAVARVILAADRG